MIITFSGVDGSGKTTHARLLAKSLSADGYRVATFKFPTERIKPMLTELISKADRLDANEVMAIQGWFAADIAAMWPVVEDAAFSDDERTICIVDRWAVDTVLYGAGDDRSAALLTDAMCAVTSRVATFGFIFTEPVVPVPRDPSRLQIPSDDVLMERVNSHWFRQSLPRFFDVGYSFMSLRRVPQDKAASAVKHAVVCAAKQARLSLDEYMA